MKEPKAKRVTCYVIARNVDEAAGLTGFFSGGREHKEAALARLQSVAPICKKCSVFKVTMTITEVQR